MKTDAASNQSIVASALNRFYQDHGLGEDGGANVRWAKVRMGGINFYIPNTAERKRALFFHDVHHLATGYGTDLRSEAEIGAWEIASGCRDFWAAWLLNFFGFAIGLFIAPARVFKAFVRGRYSRNLYHGLLEHDQIKRATVAQIRRTIDLDEQPKRARPTDVLLFGIWCTPVIVALLGIFAAIIWMF